MTVNCDRKEKEYFPSDPSPSQWTTVVCFLNVAIVSSIGISCSKKHARTNYLTIRIDISKYISNNNVIYAIIIIMNNI